LDKAEFLNSEFNLPEESKFHEDIKDTD